MIRIDVIGELDDVCIDMIAQTIARTGQGGGALVNLDALDVTWPDAMNGLAAMMRDARSAGRRCSLSVHNRRVRSLLVRGGCGDLLIPDAEDPGPSLERRIIVARHLANDGPKRHKHSAK